MPGACTRHGGALSVPLATEEPFNPWNYVNLGEPTWRIALPRIRSYGLRIFRQVFLG